MKEKGKRKKKNFLPFFPTRRKPTFVHSFKLEFLQVIVEERKKERKYTSIQVIIRSSEQYFGNHTLKAQKAKTKQKWA